MKHFLLTILFCGAFLAGFSQYHYNPGVLDPNDQGGNPGGINDIGGEFPLGSGLAASWTSIQGQSATPVWSATQTLPFAFDFNGTAVTQYKVSTSGVLTFDIAAVNVPSGTNVNLPSTDIPDNSVCIWGLAGTGGNDNIVTQTFGTAPNRQQWVFFASYNYEGGGSCWHYWSIVLEETSNNIYVVDQRKTTSATCVPSLTVGVQVDNTTAVEVAGSPNLSGDAGSDASDADNVVHQFVYGTRPDYDVAGLSFDIPTYLGLANAPFTFGAHLHNLGAQNITAMDLNYSVDGAAAVSSALSGISLGSLSGGDFSVTSAWTPAAIGTYTIKLWAANLNGNADVNNTNDTVTATVNVIGDFVVRRLLHEDFTSSSCPPCLPGGIQLRGVLANNVDSTHTLISYPMTWPSTGDPYNTVEANTRRTYYGVNSIPNLFLDGGWDGNPNGYSEGIFDDFQGTPSFMHLDATYNIDSVAAIAKKVTVNVTIDPIQDYASTNMRLFVAVYETLTENNMSNDNPNGETEWHNYMKKMLPDGAGFALTPLTANTPVTQSFDYFFPGTYRLPANAGSAINLATEHSVEEFTDLGVVVFVQDIVTGEVFQSNYAEVLCNDIVVTSSTGPDNGTANGYLKIGSVTGGVGYNYTLDGNTILTPDSLGGLTNGMYQLTVTDGYGCTKTETITIGSNVSIDDELAAGITSINTFPNPSNGEFTIKLELTQVDDLQLQIFDTKGQVVFTDNQQNVQSYQKNVSLSDLAAGVYIMVAHTSKGSISERIVIK